MPQVRVVGLLVLLSAVPAVAESVSVELTPQAMLSLRLTAADRAMAESLGAALGRSLHCGLSDVATSPSGGQWVFRARCAGVFQRRGQVIAGQLRLAGFRQALDTAKLPHRFAKPRQKHQTGCSSHMSSKSCCMISRKCNLRSRISSRLPRLNGSRPMDGSAHGSAPNELGPGPAQAQHRESLF